ncbi:Non-receptor tyrosine-protein kinase TYK2 [Frankliniella fusca]|uniref:Non-receptor tyrosine-protein kinase TYK2 n=1 Tax=Frankliniella fusca TaxID=407009 RepID=A0AAE1HF70_9NEOP|nr:Non-receptor tyrosine-protein kinase TYK2 [Frankliniella fusca]
MARTKQTKRGKKRGNPSNPEKAEGADAALHGTKKNKKRKRGKKRNLQPQNDEPQRPGWETVKGEVSEHTKDNVEEKVEDKESGDKAESS